MTNTNRIAEGMPDAEYRAHPAISRSEIEVFRKNPALWHGQRTGAIRKSEPSDDLEFGRAFHGAIAGEPQHTEIPADVLSANGSRSGQKWKEFSAANVGKILLKTAGDRGVRHLEGMLAAIGKHKIAAAAVASKVGKREISLFFEWRIKSPAAPSVTWAPCKSRLDLLIFDKADPTIPKFIIDWKTTEDAGPESFAKSSYNYGYHRQAAWYQHAVESCWPGEGRTTTFLFVAVEKSPPYRVEVYQPTEDFLHLGREENQRLVTDWAIRDADNRWEPDSWGKINELAAPGWALSKMGREEGDE